MAFCSIDDLEGVLSVASESKFVGAVQAAVRDEYNGWTLTNVHRTISDERLDRPYPFAERLEEILPWWKLLRTQTMTSNLV